MPLKQFRIVWLIVGSGILIGTTAQYTFGVESLEGRFAIGVAWSGSLAWIWALAYTKSWRRLYGGWRRLYGGWRRLSSTTRAVVLCLTILVALNAWGREAKPDPWGQTLTNWYPAMWVIGYSSEWDHGWPLPFMNRFSHGPDSEIWTHSRWALIGGGSREINLWVLNVDVAIWAALLAGVGWLVRAWRRWRDPWNAS